MQVFTSIFVLLTMFKIAVSNDDATVGSLPAEIREELETIFTNSLVNLRAVCKKTKNTKVNFSHYARENLVIPLSLDAENPTIQKGKKTIVIIHDWLSDSNSTHVINLKDEYLKKYDANVIIVDWSQFSSQRYTTAFCSIPRMSFFISNLLCNLRQQIDLKDLHIIGHGVGAHIAGVVGYYVKNKCTDRVGRITGLNPSGPLYQNSPDSRKLDKGDALFVDVIHTEQLQMGYRGNMAHADFHVNCPQVQPGCPIIHTIKNDTKINDVMCSQIRSMAYMAESVNSNNYVAYSCSFCPRFCRPDVIGGFETMMGEDCTKPPRKGSTSKFFLNTRASPPYYMGHATVDPKMAST